MKKFNLIFSLVLFLFSGTLLAQNCPNTALVINQCGSAFSLNNGTYDNCSPPQCGGACPQCVGPKNDSNFDDDCTTDAPSTGCGCDLNGSIENNMWFYFTPLSTCDYTVSITVANCNSTSGMQYACYGADFVGGGSITSYYDEEGGAGIYYNNTTNHTYGFTAGEPVYIMLDGFGGTVCDVDVVVTPDAACGGCTIALGEEAYGFKGQYVNSKNGVNLIWHSYESDNAESYIVEKSEDGINFTEIHEQKLSNNTDAHSLNYFDSNIDSQNSYYRLIKKTSIFKEVVDATVITKNLNNNIVSKKCYDIRGKELNIKDLPSGLVIYVIEYEDGTIETTKEYIESRK